MRPKSLRLLIIAVAALSEAALSNCSLFAGSKVQVGRPCTDANRPSLAEVEHQPFDTLLGKHVDDDGMVAYAQWKAKAGDLQMLDNYLSRLSCVDLSKPAPKTAQLAYWINAYNAVTIRGILREYPTSSIRNHTSRLGYNIWKDLYLWVDGRNYSLDDIEHKLLRRMGEPRIHFALVCASKGCPPLANRAYAAAELDNQLKANAQRFFAKAANFRADAGSRTVYVSQLLKWYGTDFASSPVEQIRLLRPYFPAPENLSWMDSSNFSVRYLDYDWSLNDQQSHFRR